MLVQSPVSLKIDLFIVFVSGTRNKIIAILGHLWSQVTWNDDFISGSTKALRSSDWIPFLRVHLRQMHKYNILRLNWQLKEGKSIL